MTEREKRIAIVTVVIIVIILLLLWARKRGLKIVRGYDDANMQPLNFGDLSINLGGLFVPDLGFYTGANSCGCGDAGTVKPSIPAPAPQPMIAQSIQQNYQPVQRYSGATLTSRYG